MNKRLYRALLAVFGDVETFTAADILKRSGFVAAPKFRELRLAIEAVLGPKLGAIKIGKWLEAHRDTEAGELRLSGEYDSHNKRWNYCVFTMATIEQIESELKDSARRFVKAREKKLAGRGFDQQLKQLEKDNAKLEALDEKQRAAESDRLYKEREANVKPIKTITPPEKTSRKHIYLAPERGFFLFEDKTEKRCNDLRELGFDAHIGYLSAARFVIFIDGDPDMKALKRVAERFLVKINETKNTPAKLKPKENSKEQIWDAEHQRWLPANWNKIDVTSIRLLRQAFAGGDERPTGPIRRASAYINFGWDIF